VGDVGNSFNLSEGLAHIVGDGMKLVILTGFLLEQFGCAIGVLALFATLEPEVGIMLTIITGTITLLGLCLIVIGSVLYHKERTS